MLEFQRHEIDKVSPAGGGGRGARSARRPCVANAEKLARLAGEAYGALYDDDHAAMTSLATVWKRLAELAALDPRFQPILDARESVMAPLDDAARTLRDYADSIDRSPERLQAIEDRLAALARLKRRYGPTLDDVIAKSRAVAEELGLLGAGDDALAALEQDAHAARRALSRRRRRDRRRPSHGRAAPGQGAREGARASSPWPARAARSRCTPSRPRGSGGRRAPIGSSCCISPNVGEDLRPLGRIASGGELSRVMLAMKSLASTDVPGKTLIFDEVDAGIGGAVADVVGARLHALSAGCQVLCITHLPQVAAFGDEHYRVSQAGVRRADRDARRAPRRRGPRDGGRPYDGRAGGVRRRPRRGPRSAGRAGEAKGESGPEGERRKSPFVGGFRPGRSPCPKRKRTYVVETYGCQMNVHDSERIAGLLEADGYAPAATPETADVVVVNTCSVRERAEEKLFTRLGEIRAAAAETGPAPDRRRRRLRRAAGRRRRSSSARGWSTSSSARRRSSSCRSLVARAAAGHAARR